MNDSVRPTKQLSQFSYFSQNECPNSTLLKINHLLSLPPGTLIAIVATYHALPLLRHEYFGHLIQLLGHPISSLSSHYTSFNDFIFVSGRLKDMSQSLPWKLFRTIQTPTPNLIESHVINWSLQQTVDHIATLSRTHNQQLAPFTSPSSIATTFNASRGFVVASSQENVTTFSDSVGIVKNHGDISLAVQQSASNSLTNGRGVAVCTLRPVPQATLPTGISDCLTGGCSFKVRAYADMQSKFLYSKHNGVTTLNENMTDFELIACVKCNSVDPACAAALTSKMLQIMHRNNPSSSSSSSLPDLTHSIMWSRALTCANNSPMTFALIPNQSLETAFAAQNRYCISSSVQSNTTLLPLKNLNFDHYYAGFSLDFNRPIVIESAVCNNYAMDMHWEKKYVYLYPTHRGPNQQFNFSRVSIADGLFEISIFCDGVVRHLGAAVGNDQLVDLHPSKPAGMEFQWKLREHPKGGYMLIPASGVHLAVAFFVLADFGDPFTNPFRANLGSHFARLIFLHRFYLRPIDPCNDIQCFRLSTC